jgi:hypothetical protein
VLAAAAAADAIADAVTEATPSNGDAAARPMDVAAAVAAEGYGVRVTAFGTFAKAHQPNVTAQRAAVAARAAPRAA